MPDQVHAWAATMAGLPSVTEPGRWQFDTALPRQDETIIRKTPFSTLTLLSQSARLIN